MILSDFHTHSTFCDGKHSPEDMVVSAIEKGLSSFGICVHSYTPFDSGFCAKPQDYRKFITEMARLKEKYADKIKLFCGIERDYYSPDFDEQFDYVIGSVHYIKVNNEYFPLDMSRDVFVKYCKNYFGGDFTNIAKAYFELLSEIGQKTNCKIYGHFDIITKFNENNFLFDINDKKYLEYGEKCLDTLIKHNAAFEINTGAISRGHRTLPYPEIPFLDMMKQKGAKIIMSSDSHSKENICFEFDKFCDRLNGADAVYCITQI